MEDKIKSAISDTLKEYKEQTDPIKKVHLANAISSFVNSLYTLKETEKR